MRTGMVWGLVLVMSLTTGCLPVLVGGLIWDDIEEEEACERIMLDPSAVEKLKDPTYKAIFKGRCGEFLPEEPESDDNEG